MKTISPSRAADQFLVRLPEGMRERVAEAAKSNGRSMNAEIVALLSAGLRADIPNLSSIPSDALLDAVLTRFGARIELVISQEVADQEGVGAQRKK